MELPENTFIEDYNLAMQVFGVSGIRPTYELTKEWLNDVPMWAANCYALNMWCTAFYNQSEAQSNPEKKAFFMEFVEIFSNLYHEACALGYDTYEGDEEKSSQFFHFID